ncbi:MAG: DUF523 domain-containing protein [Planctomycetota bacterium]
MVKKLSLYLASSCLVGAATRYDGAASPIKSFISFLRNKSVLLVCPEIMGGLSVPRLPARITGSFPASGEKVLAGRASVKTKNGRDVTVHFIRGAQLVQTLIKSFHIHKSYLKSKSPSCGYGSVYKGNGVLAALLKKNNIRIVSL